MDWLRRNWPDLAIGLALVAVIGGIIATLITGGTFFPSTPVAPAPVAAPTAPAVVPPATDPVVAPDEPAADAPPASPGSVSVLAPDGSDVPTEPAAAAPSEPAAPEPAAPEPATVVTPPPAASEPAPAAPSVAEPEAPSAPAPATAAPTGPLPAASVDDEAPYRVSVGAFGNPDNAARLAQTMADAGYPVFTGTQGNLTIVLVGPYDDEAEAESVSARIAGGDFGVEPIVYRFRSDATTPGASTPAPGETPAPAPTPAATPAPAPTPAPTAVPAAAAPIATSPTGRSLQVGAFADAGSAAPLRERLAAVGLVAFEIREDGLVKLLVGPFDADRLSEVRSQLSAQGIESFPR